MYAQMLFKVLKTSWYNSTIYKVLVQVKIIYNIPSLSNAERKNTLYLTFVIRELQIPMNKLRNICTARKKIAIPQANYSIKTELLHLETRVNFLGV